MESNISFIPPHLLSDMSLNTPILLALSGGADSRALLELLMEYCQKQGAALSVAHVNHMIRGKDAERDRDFCENLAKKHSLPFYLLEADVPTLAQEHGRGLEEEARIVRYDFFAKIMRENSIPLLATAHNATDNAETVIFNLSRGSGLRGLCGIPAVRDFEGGRIIRPLLKASKDEILSYCSQNGLAYVSDATNADVDYSRNRIRNNILPELLKINESVIQNISRTSEILREDDSFIESAATEFIFSQKDRFSVPLETYNSLDSAIKARVAAILLGNFFDASAAHIKSFIEIASKSVPHSCVQMPKGICVYVEDGHLNISDKPKQDPIISFDKQIFYGETILDGLDMAILIKNKENSEEHHTYLKNIYKKSITTLISFDTINDGLFIRPKRDGDKILCGKMHKKVKKLFCEKKIPLALRAKLPVFYDSKGIVWIPSVALRDSEKISKEKAEITLFYN